MRNLSRLNSAANRLQALQDYDLLIILAARYGLQSLTPPLPINMIGWRKIDEIAKQAAEDIIKARPELRDAVYVIYPGLK